MKVKLKDSYPANSLGNEYILVEKGKEYVFPDADFRLFDPSVFDIELEMKPRVEPEKKPLPSAPEMPRRGPGRPPKAR
jgi:hypothetical protein